MVINHWLFDLLSVKSERSSHNMSQKTSHWLSDAIRVKQDGLILASGRTNTNTYTGHVTIIQSEGRWGSNGNYLRDYILEDACTIWQQI